MEFADITKMWDKDSQISEGDLDKEVRDIPVLHHKYYKIFTKSRYSLTKLHEDRKAFLQLKNEYYLGELSEDQLTEQGWEPYQKMPLKNEIPRLCEGDKDVIAMNLKIARQKEKVDYLDSILRIIMNKSFYIKSMIDWIKFTNGVA